MNQKLDQMFLKICKYSLFNILKGDKQKIWPCFFLRFVSILFLIFEKREDKKLGQVFFKVCKYTFFII